MWKNKSGQAKEALRASSSGARDKSSLKRGRGRRHDRQHHHPCNQRGHKAKQYAKASPSRHCRKPTLGARHPRRSKLRINCRQQHRSDNCENFKFHTGPALDEFSAYGVTRTGFSSGSTSHTHRSPVRIASEGEDLVADLNQGLSYVRQQQKKRKL
jgi:hypothetical protein